MVDVTQVNEDLVTMDETALNQWVDDLSASAYELGKLEGARLAIEAAGERCDFLAQFPWTARRKLGAAIRALSPAKIVGEG